jgi:acetolactate synthase-1/2/3 large subunit
MLAAGIVVATSGPGATNLVTPITDAMCDGLPLIVLCGQAATTAPQDAFQSCPAVDIMRPVTKWSYQIKSAAEVPFAMDYAFYISRHGRPGPVYIDLPKDKIMQSPLGKSVVADTLLLVQTNLPERLDPKPSNNDIEQ